MFELTGNKLFIHSFRVDVFARMGSFQKFHLFLFGGMQIQLRGVDGAVAQKLLDVLGVHVLF
jgi:hypothetical protein